MRFFKRLTLLFTIFLVACDYYYAATDYKDYSILQYVSLHDKLTNGENTPNVIDIDGHCFLKKNNVWLLLNGSSNKEIKTLDENPIPCLSKNEIEWCEIVCGGLSDENINNLNDILCSN
ncbi:hypothetical protein GRP89_09535 [Citrobacter freundii]|uniref:hypothetical protein n=1 Tax=Citrobacter portucalensis TaxID=1639133 RepID=UPI00131F762B|nr:hypothetical protein [Proteus hauseri]NLR55375.1 hypothetical protein [Citrobacter freundii]QHD90265.1 hypothetical protein GRP89_09535 [Citrobacter freundii]